MTSGNGSELGDVEREFLLALDRLKGSAPTNPELVERARNGKLRINFSTVALEAGHSRTLIGTADSPYSRVREAVLEACAPYGRTGNAQKETIRLLREEISALRDKLDMRDTAYADLVIRARAFERGLLTQSESARTPESRTGNKQIIGRIGKSKNAG